MSAWQTDDEYISAQAAISLPTPQGTPYRTPSQTSRKSRRRSVTPTGKSSSPSRMINGEKGSKRSSRDVTIDENISILDPRRFTPTLHANLVSEILSLRRDQEEKLKLIESLESALQESRDEQDTLQENVTAASKETRSLQRQLSLLEGGTSSALGELARERDEAVDSVADARKRLEAAQKKIRSQEEDSQRVHELWEQEKESWEDERRKYERRIHVAESRLKMVLDEVAAYQANHVNGASQNAQNGNESEAEESARENDAASVRTMSMTNSIRFSLANGAVSLLPNGHSLADELNFDDTDDQTDVDGRDSVLSSPRHTRTFSRGSVVSKLHQRNQSMESLKRPASVARGRLFMNKAVLEILEGEDEEVQPTEPIVAPAPKPSYTDTGVQYSPPPSPKLEPVKPVTPEPPVEIEKALELETTPRAGSEIEANQRRKRVSLPLTIDPPPVYQRMVSSAAQTVELPLTPPKTPESPYKEVEVVLEEIELPKMVTASTQTEEPTPAPEPVPTPTPAPVALVVPSYPPPPPPPLAIPSISIQPPTSRPASPLSPRLPQHFKDFGCQVNLSVQVEMSDSSCQTDSIQTDKRMALLPPHLQPSSITSRPPSPNPPGIAVPEKSFTPLPGNLPPRNPRRLEGLRNSTELPSSPISLAPEDDDLADEYPGNDDGPLSSQRNAPMRRPRRYSSLLSGFYSASSDEMDEFGDAELSDSEFRTALSAPRPPSGLSRPAKRGSIGTVATSPEQPILRRSARHSVKSINTELCNSYSVGEKSCKSGRSYERPPPPPLSTSSRGSVMRKAAMIQSGIASHRARSRSPTSSLFDPKNPPFPIPTRASSRQPSISLSSGRGSPVTDGWHRRSTSRTYTRNSVRRVRSANALPRHNRNRRPSSRSPPRSPSTEGPPLSPALPPLPQNDITTPRNRAGSSVFRRHRHELSSNTDVTHNTEVMSQASNTQTPGVMEAITQTMVGEWMFKYVRRRKSFGVPDSSSKDDSSNDRHKRWVWLAPYERAILWSSKQPSSGPALLGKSGRKLTIQSVLDVKDDNAPPKGVTAPIFNRSILILTPQRALKFTASTADRHYLWLTALSFLAHSSQAIPDILAPPQSSVKQQPLPTFEPRAKLKRGGIRDSIRLAKGRTGGIKADPPGLPSLPSAPPSRMGDVASFRMTDGPGSGSNHNRELSIDAAEPPLIPRFHERKPGAAHSRKRSNTGSHVPPPLSFRGFSGPAFTGGNHHSTNGSVGTAGSSDIYQSQGSSNVTWGVSQPSSQPGSDTSSRQGQGNFFEAIGTVRMEAFISPLAYSQFGEEPDEHEEFRTHVRRRSKEVRRRNSRHRRHNRQYSGAGRGFDDYYSGNKTAGEEDFFREDPFKGF